MIKLAATKNYEFVIEDESLKTWKRLSENIEDEKSSFFFEKGKPFIGIVQDQEFQLTNSGLMKSMYTIYGNYNYYLNKGNLKISFNWKSHGSILFSLFILMAADFIIDFDLLSIAAFWIIYFILILRLFIYLLLFKKLSNKGLKDLSRILKITELKKVK